MSFTFCNRNVRFLAAMLSMAAAGCRSPVAPEAARPQPAAVVQPPAAAVFAELHAADGATIFSSLCAACHGPAGEGKRELMSPSLAGLPAWYVLPQLQKFKSGVRGSHAQDLGGLLMRSVAVNLTEGMAERVSHHLESMPPIRTQDTLEGGDLEAGTWKYESFCMACHRYNATGELFFNSPPLQYLPDWYQAGQLRKYAAGLRGSHPDDVQGAKMVLSASGLYDPEQDIVDILAYIAHLARSRPGTPQKTPR